MKKFLIKAFVLVLIMIGMLSVVSCGTEKPTTVDPLLQTTEPPMTTDIPQTTNKADPDYIDGKLLLIDEGETKYQVVYPKNLTSDAKGGTLLSSALVQIRKTFRSYGHQMVTIVNDWRASEGSTTGKVSDYEILLGHTNRPESDISDLTLDINQALIRVVGKKIVILSDHTAVTAMAAMDFIHRYMPENGKSVLIPADLDEVITVSFDDCLPLAMSYSDMGEATLNAFNEAFWTKYWVNTGRFWTGVEVLEAYVDVYEATGADKDKEAMVSYANKFIRMWNDTWGGISYNDDLMWGCTAYARLAKLTGDVDYLHTAKQNFDLNWERAWDSQLGGGLWWRSSKDSKNACVNGPGAIAACLLGDLTGDEEYYEKAKRIVDWMLEELYVAETGRVIDSYHINGTKNDYASTYNQGTFIGACTYLYQHYKDARYLEYAQKAAEFAMTELADKGILNLESDPNNADLPGFKGILVRWLYRYAKETNDVDILVFLQQNAASAYQNRNADGLIWTGWGAKTPDDAIDKHYSAWGMSAAVALMYNCRPWW